MNRAEFEEKAAPHREALSRFVAMMVGGEAEDLVQSTLADAFAQAERFEERSRFSTWLYGIALNKCRNFIRDRKRRAAPAGEEVLAAQPAPGRGVLTSVIRHEMAERLEVSVGRLPTSMREAFLLRYVDGMDYPEVAEIIGTSPGTARVRAFRARALLREELGGVVDTVWVEREEG